MFICISEWASTKAVVDATYSLWTIQSIFIVLPSPRMDRPVGNPESQHYNQSVLCTQMNYHWALCLISTLVPSGEPLLFYGNFSYSSFSSQIWKLFSLLFQTQEPDEDHGVLQLVQGWVLVHGAQSSLSSLETFLGQGQSGTNWSFRDWRSVLPPPNCEFNNIQTQDRSSGKKWFYDF